jgi:hypothetical protein
VNLIVKLAVSQPQFEDTVNNVLQRNEYRHLRNALRDLIEKAKEAIGKWILGVFEKTFQGLENAPAISDKLSTVFLIIGILVFVGLIVFILVKFDRAFDKRRRVQEILGEKIDSRTTPYTLKDKGARFAQEGDLRLGARYNFIGLLLLMHEKSLIYLDETKTNEEIYSYLRKHKFNNLTELKSLIDIFNASWYGHKEVSREGYESFNNTLELLWNEVIKHEEKSK